MKTEMLDLLILKGLAVQNILPVYFLAHIYYLAELSSKNIKISEDILFFGTIPVIFPPELPGVENILPDGIGSWSEG